MHIPDNTMVVLSLDPGGFALDLSPTIPLDRLSGVVFRRTDRRHVARFSLDPAAPLAGIEFEIEDPDLATSDAVFLISVLFFTDHHQDQYLHSPDDLHLVHSSTKQHFSVAHPPRIETAKALLAKLSVPTRIRVLVAACKIAVLIWRDWARGGDLTYFDGFGISGVSGDMAQATIQAVEDWLVNGDRAPLEKWSGEYHGLHWPMLEGEWQIPENVFYSLHAPCNLARCALGDGDIKLALVCIQQATAARATNGQDSFLGEPFRRAFLLEWWRAALKILCTDSESAAPQAS